MTNDFKKQIKGFFNRSWRTYDKHCFVQDIISNKSIELLVDNFNSFTTIADFACGTGQSTHALINSITFNKCYAVDFSEKLLLIAKQKIVNKKVKFLLSDIDNPIFNNNCLELIFCSMGLQWVPNMKFSFNLLNYYLKRSGLLLFTIPIANNFPELKHQYKNKMFEYEDLNSFLKEARFSILEYKSITIHRKFPTVYDALKSIKYTGANYRLEKSINKCFTKNNLCDLFFNPEKPSLTYHIGVFLCKKI